MLTIRQYADREGITYQGVMAKISRGNLKGRRLNIADAIATGIPEIIAAGIGARQRKKGYVWVVEEDSE